MTSKQGKKLHIGAGFKLAGLAFLALVTIFTAISISNKSFLSPTAPSSQPEAKCYPAECNTSGDCGTGYTCKAKCCISNSDPKTNSCKTDKDCSNGKKCKAGVCKSPAATPTPKPTVAPTPTITPKICNPGAKKCFNGNVVICDQFGTYWMSWESCNDGCVSGKCLVCKPGNRECTPWNFEKDSMYVWKCNNLGTDWYILEKCSSYDPERKSCSNGFCR